MVLIAVDGVAADAFYNLVEDNKILTGTGTMMNTWTAIAETISENFYDLEFIEHSTERYDHKRGFTTLTAEVQVPVKNLIEESPFISGWNISVETNDGKLSFDV